MRLEQLEQVVQIHQWGSYNIAASYLHMTHQNLSRSIQKLEEELEVTIFTRDAKGAVLTKDGESVYNFALSVMNEYRELKKKINNNPPLTRNNNSSQKLNIALTASMDLILKPLLYKLSHGNDYVAINCKNLNMEDCISAAENTAEYDLIFLQNDYNSFLEHSKPAANYRLLFLNVEKLELITSKSSPYAQYSSISRQMFKSVPIICFSHNDSPSNVAQVCINKNYPPNIVSYSNITSIIQELVSFGQVHSIAVPSAQELLWENPILKDQLTTIPIDLPFKIATAVWIKRDLCNTWLGDTIINILKQAYAKTIEEIY